MRALTSGSLYARDRHKSDVTLTEKKWQTRRELDCQMMQEISKMDEM